MVNAAATQPQSCVYTWLGRLLSTPTNSKSTERLGVFIYSLTSPYGHLFITDCSFVPRNAKNHTFPTSIIQTPL